MKPQARKVVYMTGMHGSGTSLISNYLHLCGVDMMDGQAADRLGENRAFRKLGHMILRDSRVHRYGSAVFVPGKIKPTNSTEARMRTNIERSIAAHTHQPWGWKAPINSLLIWRWLPLLQRYPIKVYVVHIYRNPAEVVESFFRRKSKRDIMFMGRNGTAKRDIEAVWINYNKSVLDFQECGSGRNVKYFFAQVPEILENPGLLNRFIGLPEKNIEVVVQKKKFIERRKVKFLWQKRGLKHWRRLKTEDPYTKR